jgi:predicted ATP-grasp superfamily ATP-dependent carboligase
MKRILIGGAGGTPGINFIRSLMLVRNEQFHTIGITCDQYDIFKAQTDERFLVPRAKDPAYIPVLKDIIAETKPDFFHMQNDAEVKVVSDHRDELAVRTFLPARETVDTCVNKVRSYYHWARAGLTVPKTMEIQTPKDLQRALRELGPRIWLRFNEGAFGYGAVPTDDFQFAKIWIDFYKGWGQFSAAECLEPSSVTWMSLWKDGELIVAQGRKRLFWAFANRNLSGVTGITGTGVTVSDPTVDAIAQRAILAIDDRPNGIFSVDLTYDRAGVPNPTEINIGRFFTTHLFFSEAGLNMPEMYVKLAFGEPLPPIPKKINPLPEGLAWIRGMDVAPVLTTERAIAETEHALAARRKRLHV